MNSRFGRISKYKNVFSQIGSKKTHYDNVKITNSVWDTNVIKANGMFLSIIWNSFGSFAVLPISESGKCPDVMPLFTGHKGNVLDIDFDPFDDYKISSCSEDKSIAIWQIPKDYSIRSKRFKFKGIQPTARLTGHEKKVGHVLYNPVIQDLLASSSFDQTVKIWDISTGETLHTLQHDEVVLSLSFSYDGNYLATLSRNRILRVWDIRNGTVISQGEAHEGVKSQRVIWLGNSNRLATTGFSNLSYRQIGIWNAFNIEDGPIKKFYSIDQSSGILMPFYDNGNKILYVVGKGDGSIRYYEFQNDELFLLSEIYFIESQRGFAVSPKSHVNVKENEILKGYKTVLDKAIEPISFYVPRWSKEFQYDIYPDCPFTKKPALTVAEWRMGKTVEGPILFSMKSLYDDSEPSLYPARKETENKAKILKDPTTSAAINQVQESKDVRKESTTETEAEPSPQPTSITNLTKTSPSSKNTLLQDIKRELAEIPSLICRLDDSIAKLRDLNLSEKHQATLITRLDRSIDQYVSKNTR
ncbi:hypothetical protein KAFR_0I00500 [Kazachstania africana CBS 2517]|uniref:Coronin n=1 Tax=Kazachstania africana (strain ATCC 22294 / BCRC 22015 / CBS 2517 / CECT 1963 / NBRC 1671 / NRRL Y-8276) TaxID=1071382 RepID=H2AZN1_KAZAF|nr:hypothetical protein KAFR_0I00500 [Kazachstania africana CBS 2517]CCF59831.1 hypothetical protein KAFR_0I00500 [Kazachstania africana CBS 2517]